MQILTTFVSCASLALLVIACEAPVQGPVSPQPSAIIGIVPARGSPSSDYCKLRQVNGQTTLSVTFRNTGDLDYAGGAPITVTFDSGTVGPHPMKPIVSGGTASHDFTVPSGCFSPDCGFSIKWSNQPPVKGICIG